MQVQIVKTEDDMYKIQIKESLGGLWHTHGRVYDADEREYLGVWHEWEGRSYFSALWECLLIYIEEWRNG
jgi:hypothetical protein